MVLDNNTILQINTLIAQINAFQAILKSEEGTNSGSQLLTADNVTKINTNIGLILDYIQTLLPQNAN